MIIPNPAIKFTYEDYKNTPDDKRYELLDGELIMAPAPNLGHQDISARLGWRLMRFVEEGDLGKVFPAPVRRGVVQHGRGAAGPAVRIPRAGATFWSAAITCRALPISSSRFCRRPRRAGTGPSSAPCTPGMASGSTGWWTQTMRR